MGELRIGCRVNSKHTLGVVSPAEDYGRLYLYCRKCKEWTPAAPPVNDPELKDLRCLRNDLQEARRARVVFDGTAFIPRTDLLPDTPLQDTRHGELLGRAALNPGALLFVRCSSHRAFHTTFSGMRDGSIIAGSGSQDLQELVAMHPQRVIR